MKVRSTLDYSQDFSKYVKYDESSETCLVWSGFDSYHKLGVKCGTMAKYKGTEKHSYTRVGFGGNIYLCHRVVWALLKGNIPHNMIIDHINGDPWDNRICNLRLLSLADNSRNRCKQYNNTTGITGVSLRNNEGFLASWMEDNAIKTKWFSINKYGFNRAKELAIEYRKEQINTLEKQGIFYSERHGT